MGARQTVRCPNCGHYFEIGKPVRRKKNMGSPYRICPVCRTILNGSGIKEYIQYNVFDKYAWFETRMGGIVFFGSFVIAYIGLGIAKLLGFSDGSVELKRTVIISFVLLESLLILGLYKYNKPEYEAQKRASIERLRNKNYQNNLISLKILTKEEIETFLNKQY